MSTLSFAAPGALGGPPATQINGSLSQFRLLLPEMWARPYIQSVRSQAHMPDSQLSRFEHLVSAITLPNIETSAEPVDYIYFGAGYAPMLMETQALLSNYYCWSAYVSPRRVPYISPSHFPWVRLILRVLIYGPRAVFRSKLIRAVIVPGYP